MNDKQLAPRPARSEWRRVVYNVLHDDGGLMESDRIWARIPQSMHVPHSKKKFEHALYNLVYTGVVRAYDQVGTRHKKYEIASLEHYKARRTEMMNRKPKPKANGSAAKKPVTRGAITGPYDATIKKIDADIENLQAQIAQMKEARAALKRLR